MTTDTLQDLFRDVDGYASSSIGRARLGNAADPAFTYGEVTPESIYTMLNFVPHAPGEVFYDLGSGTGKGVLYAAFMGQFGKTVGIELLDELHETAQGVHNRYEVEIRPELPSPQRDTAIEFKKGDIFAMDYSDADVVFAHCCTCFPDELMEQLSKKLEHLKPGARVVCVTRSVNSDKFVYLGSAPCQMGWGMATLNLYQRI